MQDNIEDLKSAMAEALPACAPACKGKRLACLQSLCSQLSLEQLQAVSSSLLGEVVLATREVNVKTRAAAFDLLTHLAEQAERRASGGDGARAAAVRSFLITVAAGLAGNTPHMMAATLSALARLVFELRERSELIHTSTQLFATVLTLLQHKAQEVVRAAIVFCKVRSPYEAYWEACHIKVVARAAIVPCKVRRRACPSTWLPLLSSPALPAEL